MGDRLKQFLDKRIQWYQQSMKLYEAEEFVDLVFYRPLAVLFVSVVYRFPVTPNQISFLSMIAGIIAGWQFSIFSKLHLLFGSVFLAVSIVLDCSDGQIARLKNNGTPLGRIIDGIADYITGFAIFIGIGIGAFPDSSWLIVIPAGLSSALHAIVFDHYQRKFITVIKGETTTLSEEIAWFTSCLPSMNKQRRWSMRAMFTRLYLLYLRLQIKSVAHSAHIQHVPDEYRWKNSLAIRLWSFLGPSTNRTILIVCALSGHIEWYLWTILIGGNLWLSGCLFVQMRIDSHRMVQ